MLAVPADANSVYHYSKSTKSLKNAVYYVCIKCRTNSAKNNAVLYKDSGDLYVDPDHSCTPIPLTIHQNEQLDRRVRQLCAKGFDPTIAHNHGFKEAEDAGLNIADFFHVRKQYSRWRGANFPRCEPGKIDERFYTLYGSNGTPWKLHETKDVTIFATPLALRAMATSDILQLDATFSTCPVGFTQYLTMHALLGNGEGKEWQPVLMAVMTGKKAEYYELIVDQILAFWARENIIPTFQRIHSDYECALQKAIGRLNGPDKVYGCVFHYCQAVLKHAMNLGLGPYYKMFDGKTDFPASRRPIRTW